MLNIIVDIRALLGNQHSGVEIYIKKLILNLSKIDTKNQYYLFINSFKKSNTSYNFFKNSSNFHLVETSIPNKLLNLSLTFLKWPKIDKLINRKLQKNINFDLFFLPDLRPFALSKHVKSVGTIHDLSFKHFPYFFSWKSRLWYKIIRPKLLIRRLNQLISVSNFTKKDLIKTFKISKKKVTAVYLGKNESPENIKNFHEIRRKYNLPDKYFLFLSTLQPRKNLERAIEAFRKFKISNPESDISLVIAGKENARLFAKLKLKGEFKNNLYWIGFVEEEEKFTLIKNALLFLYPSLYEGFGLPLLEAMSLNVPVVTSNVSSMPEIVGQGAVLVDPYSIDSIYKGMEIALKKLDEFKEINQIRLKEFQWEKCARETIRVFNQML